MRTDRLTLSQSEFVPAELSPGVLYASNVYGTASHLCACGCGGRTVTPLGPDGWVLTDGPTLHPSVLNRWCGAHYLLRGGEVVWVP